jgi:hypothetical protein
MQVLPDAVILNLSRAQREMIRNPKHSDYMAGMELPDGHRRLRVNVADIPAMVQRLRALRAVIADDSEYAKRHPHQVIDRIILKLEDGAAAQGRAYPADSN